MYYSQNPEPKQLKNYFVKCKGDWWSNTKNFLEFIRVFFSRMCSCILKKLVKKMNSKNVLKIVFKLWSNRYSKNFYLWEQILNPWFNHSCIRKEVICAHSLLHWSHTFQCSMNLTTPTNTSIVPARMAATSGNICHHRISNHRTRSCTALGKM